MIADEDVGASTGEPDHFGHFAQGRVLDGGRAMVLAHRHAQHVRQLPVLGERFDHLGVVDAQRVRFRNQQIGVTSSRSSQSSSYCGPSIWAKSNVPMSISSAATKQSSCRAISVLLPIMRAAAAAYILPPPEGQVIEPRLLGLDAVQQREAKHESP